MTEGWSRRVVAESAAVVLVGALVGSVAVLLAVAGAWDGATGAPLFLVATGVATVVESVAIGIVWGAWGRRSGARGVETVRGRRMLQLLGSAGCVLLGAAVVAAVVSVGLVPFACLGVVVPAVVGALAVLTRGRSAAEPER